MTHLLFHKTPNSVSSEPGAAHMDELKMMSLPIKLAAACQVSTLQAAAIKISRSSWREGSAATAPGSLHVWQTSPRCQEGAVKMNGYHLLPVIEGEALDPMQCGDDRTRTWRPQIQSCLASDRHSRLMKRTQSARIKTPSKGMPMVDGIFWSLRKQYNAQSFPGTQPAVCSGFDRRPFCRKLMDQGDFTILACLKENRPKLTASCRQVLVNNGQ